MSSARTNTSSGGQEEQFGQGFLINLMKYLSYRSYEEGVCFGIAAMGLQAFLAQDIDSFDARLRALNKAWLMLTLEEKEAKENQLPKLMNCLLKDEAWIGTDVDAREHRIRAEIIAFFDGIELYQQPDFYPDWFEKNKAPRVQNVPLTLPLVISEALEKKGEIFRVPVSAGAYSREDLKSYLSILEKEILFNLSTPCTLIISSVKHAIALGYDPNKRSWCLINANQLPSKHFSINAEEKILKMLFGAFESGKNKNYQVVISVALYGINPRQSKVTETSVQSQIVALNDNQEWIALHYHSAKINTSDNNGYTPLYTAVAHGHAAVVKALIGADGINVNQADKNGITPLSVAAVNGHAEAVKTLIGADGVNVNQADKDGITPLYAAAVNGHAEAVKTLIGADGINVNQADKYDFTPLYAAAAHGHAEAVKTLIGADGINVDQADKDDFTPLYTAAAHGHAEVVKALIGAGADVNRLCAGFTALEVAKAEGHAEIIALLDVSSDSPPPEHPHM